MIVPFRHLTKCRLLHRNATLLYSFWYSICKVIFGVIEYLAHLSDVGKILDGADILLSVFTVMLQNKVLKTNRNPIT